MGKDTFVNSGGPDPFDARIGTLLAGKWTLVRLLGVGGMASVYEARHEIGRKEAIKILHAQTARQPELRMRFEQEAHAVNRLEHPAVVQIRDTGTTDDGCPFLVMELLDGSSMAERMEAGSLSVEAGLNHVDTLLDVLAVAHGEDIIHRDLKPDNLFITEADRLKVLDFGIARVRASSAMKVVTQTGTALGTPSYMPPEQIKGVDVDHRADLFAVGAILWELLTGSDVHEASSSQELLVKMLTTPARPLLSVAPQIGPALAQVVDRALAFEANDRYPDARTMQHDLREARRGMPPPFAAAPAGSPTGSADKATLARAPQAIARTSSGVASSSLPPVSAVPSLGAPGVPTSSIAPSSLTPSSSASSWAAPGWAAPGLAAPSLATPNSATTSLAAPSAVAPTGHTASAPFSHAPAHSFVQPASSSEPRSEPKRLILAIIVMGTLVGALATVLVLRSLADDESSTTSDEVPRRRSRGAGNDDAPTDSDSPPEPSGSVPPISPDPSAAEPTEPKPASPDRTTPVPQPAPDPAGPNPNPEPKTIEPNNPEPKTVEPKSVEPKTVEPNPRPIDPSPPALPRPVPQPPKRNKGKKRKKKGD